MLIDFEKLQEERERVMTEKLMSWAELCQSPKNKDDRLSRVSFVYFKKRGVVSKRSLRKLKLLGFDTDKIILKKG